MLAVSAWLYERGIPAPTAAWHIEIILDTEPRTRPFAEAVDTRFQLFLRQDEWGFTFCHGGRVSRLRITDLVRSELRDDHSLVKATPALRQIGTLVRQLEARHGIRLRRNDAAIATTLPEAEPLVRAWVATL
jgi:hypothetical protein